MTQAPKMPEAPKPGAVADAAPQNWVDTYCPAGSRPYFRLSRADRPIGTWLLLIPCLWGLLLAVLAKPSGSLAYTLWLVVVFAAGSFLMRGAGCTWNDITDRHIDAQVARTRSRPLPSGQVSLKQALGWMALQVFIAFLLLLTLNLNTMLLCVAALGPVVIYPFAKRYTWWPQVFLGIAFNWGALAGWTAYSGKLEVPAVLLYLCGISWTLFYDTIYAHQDKEDDALIGVKSTARLFADDTPQWLTLFLLVCVFLMSAAVLAALGPVHGLLACIIPLIAVAAFGLHLKYQLGQLNTDDVQICQDLFLSNKTAGFLPVAGFVIALAGQWISN